MNLFPAVDPIPLPAPVWVFKLLHILTLALHFTAVELLLGGLLVAVWFNFRGAGGSALGDLARRDAAASIAKRLPIVMTYVINLGVPPLLFAQVLYGQALYTSSVLIGTWWISVVFLLMACYWLLYRFAAGTEAGESVWWKGLLAWLLAGLIARILSTNMTLMLRPDHWQDMYAAAAIGSRLPSFDPTLTPRWLFMLAGGLWVTGLWMLWLAGRRTIEPPAREFLARAGGWLAAVMILVQAGLGFWVWHTQPEAVRRGMMENVYLRTAGLVWLGLAAAVFLFGAWGGLKKLQSRAAGWLVVALTLVTLLAMTTFRDGIRDVSLKLQGLDVWRPAAEPVVNWSVLGLFVVVFAAGLGGMAWLISVVMRAKPVSEKVS